MLDVSSEERIGILSRGTTQHEQPPSTAYEQATSDSHPAATGLNPFSVTRFVIPGIFSLGFFSWLLLTPAVQIARPGKKEESYTMEESYKSQQHFYFRCCHALLLGIRVYQ